MQIDQAIPNQLPHSIDAEQSLIGSLLLDNSAWDRIADIVNATDFYIDEYRNIFSRIVKMLESGRKADVATVFEELKTSNPDNQSVDLACLREFTIATPSAANIQTYAQMVREKSILRHLIQTCREIIEDALNSLNRDTQDIIDAAERKIFEITEVGASARRYTVSLNEAIAGAIAKMESRLAQDNLSIVTGIATGYVEVDHLTSGLQRGDLVVIAGNPSAGKTTLASNIAEHVAVDLKMPVLVFSLDLSADQLAMRLLASRSRIDITRLLKTNLTDEDLQRLTVGLSVLHDTPLHIEARGTVSFPALRTIARRVQQERNGLGLIVIDSIGMIAGHPNCKDHPAHLVSTSRALKHLAKELNVPIIVSSDRGGCGEIEIDADVVMLIDNRNELMQDMPKGSGITEVIISKHRNGPTGMVRLQFLKEYCCFEDLAKTA